MRKETTSPATVLAPAPADVGKATRPGTESPARDTKNVKSIGETWREIVDDVCGVPNAREEDHRRAGAAPVDNLQRDICASLHESGSGYTAITRLRIEGWGADREANQQQQKGAKLRRRILSG